MRYPHAVNFLLLGDAAVPAAPTGAISAMLTGEANRPAQGALWAAFAAPAWAAAEAHWPGALAWLRRVHTT